MGFLNKKGTSLFKGTEYIGQSVAILDPAGILASIHSRATCRVSL